MEETPVHATATVPAADAPGTRVGRGQKWGDAWPGRWREDLLLSALVAGIFLANLAVSLALPNAGIWGPDRALGYRMNMLLTMTGLYLLFPPAFLLIGLLTLDADSLPAAPYLLAWTGGVAAMAVVATHFRTVPAWRRTAYAILIGMQLSGFGAAHWATVGQ